MELIYLWIEDYNNIHETGFTFSNNYEISFNRAEKSLEIQKNNIDHLQLYNQCFLNINAIIGKNGSGKSSLISFVKKIFIESFYQHERFLAIVKKIDGNLIVIDKYLPEAENLNLVDPDSINPSLHKNTNEIQSNVNLLFFSHSFSVYEELPYGQKYLDISSYKQLYLNTVDSNTFLLKRTEEILKQYDNQKTEDYEREKNYLIKSALPISRFYYTELKNKIKFISEYKDDERFNFIPKLLNLELNPFYFFNNKEEYIRIGLNDKLITLQFLVFEKEIPHDNIDLTKQSLKDRTLILLFLYVLQNGLINQTSNLTEEQIISEFIAVENIELIPNFIKEKLLSGEVANFPDLDYFKIKEFILNLDNLVDNLSFYNTFSSSSFGLVINLELKEFFNQIFDFWYNYDFIFSFYWTGLSAGQSALISLFSRINSYSEFPDKQNIWLLIDEGELYLHPEWQQKILNDLHKYLPLFFSNRRIQLFITSHSPFLISDLPKENIVLLDKKSNGQCLIVDKSKIQNTFGANIHELLSNSFFLSNGLIGNFAQEKINDLFDYLLKNESKFPWTPQSALALINIVGEPIVKTHLLQIYDKKFKTREEIGFIEAEINRLNELKLKFEQNDSNRTE